MTTPEKLYVTYFWLSGPQTEAYLVDGPDGDEGCPVIAAYVREDVAAAREVAVEAKYKNRDVEVMRVALADLRRIRACFVARANSLRTIGEVARASGLEDAIKQLDEEVFA